MTIILFSFIPNKMFPLSECQFIICCSPLSKTFWYLDVELRHLFYSLEIAFNFLTILWFLKKFFSMQANDISDYHANTHIPIVVGSQMRFEITGDPLYKVNCFMYIICCWLLFHQVCEELCLFNSYWHKFINFFLLYHLQSLLVMLSSQLSIMTLVVNALWKKHIHLVV